MSLGRRIAVLLVTLGFLPAVLALGVGTVLAERLAMVRTQAQADAVVAERLDRLERQIDTQRRWLGLQISRWHTVSAVVPKPAESWFRGQPAVQAALRVRPGLLLRVTGVGPDGERWQVSRPGLLPPPAAAGAASTTVWRDTGAVLVLRPAPAGLGGLDATAELSIHNLLAAAGRDGAGVGWVSTGGRFLDHDEPGRIGLPDTAWQSPAGWLTAAVVHQDTGWTLGAAVSPAPALAALRSEALQVGGALAGILVLLTVGMVALTRGTAQDLRQLQAGLDAWERGDVHSRLALTSPELSGLGQQLNRLVDDLQTRGAEALRDRQRGTTPPEASLVDVGPVVAAALARCHRPGVQVVQDLTPWAVRCRPDRLVQLVDALVDRALSAVSEEGTVRVRLHPGLIEVADDGPGLSPVDVANQLFRPLATVGRGPDDLGMAGARVAARDLGWVLEVESDPHAGTAVRARTPAYQGEMSV